MNAASRRLPRYLIAVLAAAALGALLYGVWRAGRAPAGEVTIHVSAAISLREPLMEIAAAFERDNPGTRIELNFAGTNMLVRQILEGAPCGIFISADRENMDKLIAAGRVDRVEVEDLLRNELVIIALADDAIEITSPADLSRPEVGPLAACDEAVPIGAYTRAYLRKKERERLLENSPRFDNVAAACAAVASGQMRLGFAYRSDVRPRGKLRIAFQPPPEDQPEIVYPAAIIARDGMRPEAEVQPARTGFFFEFVRSPRARAIFERHGFTWAVDER